MKEMSDNHITLDVIVLTYNRAEYFERTLRSVCDQTYNDFTVKVLNNGSTDNTEEVFNKVKAEYPDRKIEYLKLEENHLDEYFVEQRNNFITADYVIQFHDDDLMHPQYVETIMSILQKESNVVLLGAKSKMSEQPEALEWDKPSGNYLSGSANDLAKWYYRGDSLAFPTVCYKTDLFKNILYNETLYGNRGDIPWLLDIASHGKACELQDRFIHYRIHKGNDYHNLPTIEQRVNLIKKIGSYLLDKDEESKRIFNNKMYQMCVGTEFITAETAYSSGLLNPDMMSIISKACPLPLIRPKLFFYMLVNFVYSLFGKTYKAYKKYKLINDLYTACLKVKNV